MGLCWEEQGGLEPPTRGRNALVVAEPGPKSERKPDSYWDWLHDDLTDKIMALVWPMRRKPTLERSGYDRSPPSWSVGPWLERGGFRPRLWPAGRVGCAEQARWLTAEQKELGIYLYGQGADAWYLFAKHETPRQAELEFRDNSPPLQMDFKSPLPELPEPEPDELDPLSSAPDVAVGFGDPTDYQLGLGFDPLISAPDVIDELAYRLGLGVSSPSIATSDCTVRSCVIPNDGSASSIGVDPLTSAPDVPDASALPEPNQTEIALGAPMYLAYHKDGQVSVDHGWGAGAILCKQLRVPEFGYWGSHEAEVHRHLENSLDSPCEPNAVSVKDIQAALYIHGP